MSLLRGSSCPQQKEHVTRREEPVLCRGKHRFVCVNVSPRMLLLVRRMKHAHKPQGWVYVRSTVPVVRAALFESQQQSIF